MSEIDPSIPKPSFVLDNIALAAYLAVERSLLKDTHGPMNAAWDVHRRGNPELCAPMKEIGAQQDEILEALREKIGDLSLETKSIRIVEAEAYTEITKTSSGVPLSRLRTSKQIRERVGRVANVSVWLNGDPEIEFEPRRRPSILRPKRVKTYLINSLTSRFVVEPTPQAYFDWLQEHDPALA